MEGEGEGEDDGPRGGEEGGKLGEEDKLAVAVIRVGNTTTTGGGGEGEGEGKVVGGRVAARTEMARWPIEGGGCSSEKLMRCWE